MVPGAGHRSSSCQDSLTLVSSCYTDVPLSLRSTGMAGKSAALWTHPQEGLVFVARVRLCLSVAVALGPLVLCSLTWVPHLVLIGPMVSPSDAVASVLGCVIV